MHLGKGDAVEFESREDEEEFYWEGRRSATAVLLKSRGAAQAAAAVAVSHYRSDYAGDGRYIITLAVPPELYDYAKGVLSDDIRNACIDVVGADKFANLVFRVRTPTYDSDWVSAIVSSLERTWVPSERVDVPSLEK
jgi:hypothetical protein